MVRELGIRHYRLDVDGQTREGFCSGATLRKMREDPTCKVTGRYLIEHLLSAHAATKDVRRPSTELKNTRELPIRVPKT